MKRIMSKVKNSKRKRSSSGNEASPSKIKRKDANSSENKLSKVDDDHVGEDGRDLENIPENEGICNRNREEESEFENVIKMLKLPQSRNAGLKKFSEICRKDNENVRQSIRTYLLSSPELKDLFNLLEGEERPSDQEAKLIWNAFESLLLLTSNSEKSLQDIGMYIVNKILSKFLKMLYSAISLSSPHDITKSVLKLLTSFVAQGRNGAAEVLNTFDFGLKGLEAVSKKRDNKAKIDVRTCYLQFYLSFFIFGDQNIIKDLLSVPVFTNGVVNGLLKDSLPMVHLVLSTLNEKVVKNEKLLKKTKFALFNAHTLSQLTQLFVNLKNQDNEKTSTLRYEIQSLIIQTLHTLCTDPELGILFAKNEGNLAARSNNPILLNFLRSIQKLAVSDQELRDLTSKTLAKAPDLVLPYTSRLNLNLEPRDSEPWLNSIGFLIEVWTQLPSFEGLFDDLKSKKSVQLIIGLVIPSVFGRQHLTNGLKHKSLIVKRKTAELLKVCLQRGTLASKYIRQQEHLQKQIIAGIFEMFCEGVLSHLPDVRVFIACMEHSGQTDSKNASMEKSTAGTNGLSSLNEKAKPGIQEDDFQNSVIQIMLCVQQLQPGIFSSADYSLCKLFKNEDLGMFLQSERLSVALEIASLEPVGNLKWFGKKSDLFQNALRTIYIAFAESASLKIKNSSRKFIKRLIFASGSITENIDEVEVWLDAFAKASAVTEDRVIASFFQKMCASVSQDLYYITDEILEYATADTACEESMDTDVLQSDVRASNYSIGFTPLVVAAARNFTKHWLNEDKSVLMSVSKFVSFVLMEVLMSQDNPITLLRIIKKYVSVIRENGNAAGSGWLSHWLELENFACYWCSEWNETIRQSSQSFSKCTTEPLVNSTSAILRSKLPFSTDEFASNSHTASFLIDEITKVLRDTPTSCVCDVIGRSTRVVLAVSRKSCDLSSNSVSSFSLILLKKVLLVFMERLPEVREYEVCEGEEKKRNSFDEVFQVVFNDAVVKNRFLDCERVEEAEIVTEIMELALGNAKSTRLMTFLRPYFCQLSKSVLKTVKSLQKHSFSVESKPNKLVFRSLDIMANHMLNSDRNDLLSGLLDLLLDCDLEASILEDSGMIHAIRLLLDIILDKTVILNEPRVYSANSFAMKDSLIEVRDARKFGSIYITSKGITALFTLLGKYDNSDLQGAILSLLEADNLYTYLAPISIVDFCLRSGSGTSIKILKLLCQSSVVHASIIRRKLISHRELFTLSSLVHILYTLLSKGCWGDEEREKLFTQEVVLQDLVPLIANPEDFPRQVVDDEVKMALEIVALSIEEREALSAILVKGLRKLTKFPKISSQCSYQIKLFQDVCVPEEASKSESKVIIEALMYLMKIWERTLSSKDPEESFEQAICGCINKLCNSLQKGTISKLKDHTLEEVIKNWSTLLPSCLKRRIGHPESMVTVKNLLNLLYSMKSFNGRSSLTLENIYQYVLSHSQFLSILLQEDPHGKSKDALVGLLLAVADFGVNVFEKPHLAVLTTAYHCTLSSTDRKILCLLRLYEENGISISSLRPLVWGKKALERRKENSDSGQTLYSQTEMKDVIESLDRNMLIKSAFNFPLKIDVTESDDDESSTSTREDIYDPRFLLPLFSRFLSQDYKVDCRKFIDSGCLAFVVAAMSSQVVLTRKAAFHIMARFMNQLHSSRFVEKNQIVILLEALKNGINEEAQYIPSIISTFVLRCLQVLLRPEQHLYPRLNHFLLKGPFLDMRNVPLLTQMLNSSDLEYVTERSWIIQLMAAGLRTPADYYIYKKNHVFQQIMSLYNSTLCDVTAKKSIRDVIIGASQIHQAAFDLIKSNGLLSWLHAILQSNSDDQTHFVVEVLNNLLKTFKQGLEVLNEEGETETRNPLPQQFTMECAMLCMRLVNDCSQNLKVEQLLSITNVLNWCLSIEGGIVNAGFSISWHQIKTLLEFVDNFTRKEKQSDNEQIGKVLEQTVSTAKHWLDLSKDIIATFHSGQAQDLHYFLCCWLLKLARCQNINLETISIISKMFSTLNTLYPEWSSLITSHGGKMADLLTDVALFHSCSVFPKIDMGCLVDFKNASEKVGELLMQTALLASNMARSLLTLGEDLQDASALISVYRLLKSEKYQNILKHNFPEFSTTVENRDRNISNKRDWLYRKSLLILLVDALKGKEDPSDVTVFVEMFPDNWP